MSLLATAGLAGAIGIGNGVGAGVTSKLFGNKSGDIGDDLAYAQEQQAISSAMRGSDASSGDQSAPVNTEGILNKKFVNEMMQGAVKSGVESVVGGTVNAGMSAIFDPSAKKLGKQNRDYMNAAYPELNAWEKAGASATQAGIQTAQTGMQMRMQQKQLDNNVEIAKISADTQKDVAKLNAGVSIANTRAGLVPTYAQLPFLVNKHQEEIQSIKSNTKLTNAQRNSEINRTNLIYQQAMREQYGKSGVGSILFDFGNVLDSSVRSVIGAGKNMINKIGPRREMKSNVDTSGVKSSFRALRSDQVKNYHKYRRNFMQSGMY